MVEVAFVATQVHSLQLVTWSTDPELFVLTVVMFVLLQTLGNFLLAAMIAFEKYGMDPQKRTAINQIVSFCCYTLLFGNVATAPFAVWRYTIGKLGNFDIITTAC